MIRNKGKRFGFSLVELVVVIVIIGILAAIAVPRLSRGSAGAGTAALQANLSLVRNAINMYAAEHNNDFPGDTAADFVAQLTQFTDAKGNVSATRDDDHPFGPYLLSVPACPVGENSGSADVLVDATNSPPDVVTTGGEGWVYNPNTGDIRANSTQTDDTGTAFNTY